MIIRKRSKTPSEVSRIVQCGITPMSRSIRKGAALGGRLPRPRGFGVFLKHGDVLTTTLASTTLTTPPGPVIAEKEAECNPNERAPEGNDITGSPPE